MTIDTVAAAIFVFNSSLAGIQSDVVVTADKSWPTMPLENSRTMQPPAAPFGYSRIQFRRASSAGPIPCPELVLEKAKCPNAWGDEPDFDLRTFERRLEQPIPRIPALFVK